jgi:hypothetical protein
MAAIVFVLFAISTGSAPPDLISLAQFSTKEACDAAAATIQDALAKGNDPKMLLCVSSDSLKDMVRKNGMAGV